MPENRYKTALEIQDACNLTAVVGVLHRICLEVLHEGKGTASVCKDPAVRMIVDKVYDLAGRVEGKEYTEAYLACCHESGIVISTQEVSNVTA
jgi:hypothetical protein